MNIEYIRIALTKRKHTNYNNTCADPYDYLWLERREEARAGASERDARGNGDARDARQDDR